MTKTYSPRKRLTQQQIRLVRSAGVASVGVAATLVAIKLYAWYATNSIALLSSLADSLLDLLASVMTLTAVKFALEPPDREHRFGHGKLEAIAGLSQGLVISASALYVAWRAILRLVAPEPVTEPAVGMGIMLVSLALTIALVLYQRRVVAQTGSIAVGADAVHYKADVLTNLAVLAAIGASTWLGWHWADPVLGLVVVVLIGLSVWQIIVGSIDVLLDRELPAERRAEILELARAHADVLGVHALRTRTSGTHEFIQFHIELRPELELARVHRICDAVEASVTQRFPRAEVIIHADPHGLVEPPDEF